MGLQRDRTWYWVPPTGVTFGITNVRLGITATITAMNKRKGSKDTWDDRDEGALLAWQAALRAVSELEAAHKASEKGKAVAK